MGMRPVVRCAELYSSRVACLTTLHCAALTRAVPADYVKINADYSTVRSSRVGSLALHHGSALH